MSSLFSAEMSQLQFYYRGVFAKMQHLFAFFNRYIVVIYSSVFWRKLSEKCFPPFLGNVFLFTSTHFYSKSVEHHMTSGSSPQCTIFSLLAECSFFPSLFIYTITSPFMHSFSRCPLPPLHSQISACPNILRAGGKYGMLPNKTRHCYAGRCFLICPTIFQREVPTWNQ